MTTVWTASNIRRQDGRYNSLSRSLGSLMSIVLDEDKSPSVLIFSNQSPRETNLQTSVSVGDRVGDENILPLNGLSFRSLQTDSSSSIAFVGKKIKREYQSAFVLPDKQTIGIIRQEAFMTEEGLAQVTLSLCVSTNLDSLQVSKSERICDYLDTDYWASILLASTESHDAELLGYMGPEYTSRKSNRFNFERSESRRRKREIVLVQEEIEDSDEKDNVGKFDSSNILPESVTVYEKLYPKGKEESDSQTSRLILHPPPPLPPPQLPESPLPSPPKTLKVSERNASPKPQPISSRNSCQPKEQAPIIGRAEPPGKTKPIVSSPKSKENFEKLKRQWNNRIAQMQEHLDNQYRDTPTSLPQTYTEGHRGSTVTSILPTVDKRSSDPYVKSRISSTDRRSSPEQAYDHQSLPDRTSMDHGSDKENFIFQGFDYISSSLPGSGDLVDPVTERCEKDAQFIYSQARLFVNQQNIGRLSPRKLSVDRGGRHLTTTETPGKVTDELPGHRRHPPPPLSPNAKEDMHYPRDGTVSRSRISDGSKAATPLTPTRHSLRNLGDDSEKRKRQQKVFDDEFRNANGESMPLDPRKPNTQFNYGILPHPDEYNYLAEAEKQKPSIDFASELSYDSSLYGKTSQGSCRKQPPIKHYDKYKDKKSDKPHRHPPPPQPIGHDQTKRLDDKPSPKLDRRSRHGIVSCDENYYVNVPGSGPPGVLPPYNGHKRSLQDLSERSGPHSAYDPRLGDTINQPSKPRTRDKISDQVPDYYDQYTSNESDYDDSGESDEELKPPALRTITQTRRRSEPEPSNNYPPVQLRRPSKGQKTGQSITSIHDSLISPEGMSIPSTPGYENIYGIYYDDKTGKYVKGLDHDHSNGMSQERISRPRSKHTTATSRSSGYYGINGSKHSLIISTKRRTLSGLTGTHPSKHRSSSMNTLWFGDHPVPSERTLSPATPVRLSNIQIQAQAELERRHRSSSHGHSLDRKSVYSTGMTESHLSKGLSDYHQGYEGIGYSYDNRGRLIHGGACLPERSASRKRRLLDGHESLSRVWIPQSGEQYSVKQISDRTASSLTNRDERQAQLDNSAMAFALRDFTVPKIRNLTGHNHFNNHSSLIRSKSFQQFTDFNKSTHTTMMKMMSTMEVFKLWKSDLILYRSNHTFETDPRSWLYLSYNIKYLHETTV
ncbi:unnamed protein product [Schistosoma rodhaini]|uniref:Uncharacterized protein n=1 Tax=Schistosoma rodhaini TaxID=6188 RepID=A0AA85G602_9TREM|nr:unnamed protein product [Schistosoma rodhaini]CAH8611989.1 unnamed protein product [Schistosoma rodhaini]